MQLSPKKKKLAVHMRPHSVKAKNLHGITLSKTGGARKITEDPARSPVQGRSFRRYPVRFPEGPGSLVGGRRDHGRSEGLLLRPTDCFSVRGNRPTQPCRLHVGG